MQRYKFFVEAEFAETNRMLSKFPGCLKIAFIDCEEKGAFGQADAVHERQRRRYFSCLIDRECGEEVDGRRRPHYRIELPGYPILGDGKSDNQNHAIPFMRGTFSQCIDANQGAYFEQMLLLPCVLGEFRSSYRGDGGGKKIIGLPEHITSDIGSVGDMAASAELAFGTILQRTYAVLGARMHYGHPDIMNKHYMMQQGGVSKATKTLNLSEDIFAGMDFTLRGQGREIKHCEYFHLAKGRDLGFNTVLGFFSKLASGSGEQILTRQMFRIGQVFHLPEALSFHYAHVGYYLNQYLISWCLPCLMMVWLMVLLSDCDDSFGSFQTCTGDYGDRSRSSAEIMSDVMSTYFSWVLILFLIATSMPLFAEMWIERSFKMASVRFLKQILTLSPLLFIFQAKVIGHYIVNELRFGGATYVSTGRGLPTDRRWFIGEPKAKGFHLAKEGGLFLDYAQIAYYDGFFFLLLCILIPLVGGVKDTATGSLVWLWVSIALVITSWLFAPFIFNPYQFVWRRFKDDCRAWCAFFFRKRGKHWVNWYERTQLKPKGTHRFAVDFSFILAAFLLLGWGELVLRKITTLDAVYSSAISDFEYTLIMAPAVMASVAFSFVVVAIQGLLWHCSGCVCTSRCCNGSIGMPVAIAAIFVTLLDLAEAGFALYKLYIIGWYNVILAALILKFAMLTVLLRLTESLLRMRCFRESQDIWGTPLVHDVLEFWLRAHRMWRDMMVSFFILVALVPWVLLNSLNDHLCLGCSLHKLLIYRDGGHFGREKLDFHLSHKQSTKTFGTMFGGSKLSRYPGSERDSDCESTYPSTARSKTSRGQAISIGARVTLEWQGRTIQGTVHELPDEDTTGQGRFKVHCDGDPEHTMTMTKHVKLLAETAPLPTLLSGPASLIGKWVTALVDGQHEVPNEQAEREQANGTHESRGKSETENQRTPALTADVENTSGPSRPSCGEGPANPVDEIALVDSTPDTSKLDTVGTVPVGETESAGSNQEVWEVPDITHPPLPPCSDTQPRLPVSSRSPSVTWDPSVVDPNEQPQQRRRVMSLPLTNWLNSGRKRRSRQSPTGSTRSEPVDMV
jgi:hypothetical protein